MPHVLVGPGWYATRLKEIQLALARHADAHSEGDCVGVTNAGPIAPPPVSNAGVGGRNESKGEAKVAASQHARSMDII